MNQSKNSTQPDISTFTNVINPLEFKWTSYFNCQSPQDDQRNFNPDYESTK